MLCTAEVEGVFLGHRLLAPHARYYVREMRVLAYNQLLESYKRCVYLYICMWMDAVLTWQRDPGEYGQGLWRQRQLH